MSLKQQAVNSIKWTSASTVIVTLLALVQIAILTRLLEPSLFGLMAILAVIIGLCQVFSDIGLSNAIIYRQNIVAEHLSSLYWLNVAAGLIIFLAIILATPFITAFYLEPRLTSLLPWAGLIFLVTFPGQQFRILTQKELIFNRLAKIDVVASFSGVLCTIALAFAGAGIMALIAGQLVSAAARTSLLVATGWNDWHPQLHFRLSDLNGYLGFGLYQVGERMLNYLSSSIDVLIIGKFLGPGILGYYSLAYQIIITPMVKINPIITSVAFPVFARHQGQNAMLRLGYRQMAGFLSFVCLPIFTGMIVTAPLFVPILLGPQWTPAVPLIQILSIVGIFKTFSSPFGTIYLAKGRAQLGFLLNLFGLVSMLVIFSAAISYGIIAFALSYIFECLIFYVIFQSIIGRILNLGWYEYLYTIYKQLMASICMGAVVFLSSILLSSLIINTTTLLLIEMMIGLTCYLLLSAISNQEYLRELWQMVLPQQTRVQVSESNS
jgi:O-antigen/teichoic acid export membrane protein